MNRRKRKRSLPSDLLRGVLIGLVVSTFIKMAFLGAPFALATLNPIDKSIHPWRSDIITYQLPKDFALRKEFLLAASRWNTSGAGPQFVEAQGKADLVVELMPGEQTQMRCPKVNCWAYSTAGYRGVQQSHMVISDELALYRGPQTSRQSMFVIEHELGHVLGLEHSQRTCSVMQPALSTQGCPAYEVQHGRLAYCGPSAEDLKAVARIYNRQYRNTGIWCRADWDPLLFAPS
jgi:Matrixin